MIFFFPVVFSQANETFQLQDVAVLLYCCEAGILLQQSIFMRIQ